MIGRDRGCDVQLRDPLVIWRNPGGQLVAHSYTLAPDALRARD